MLTLAADTEVIQGVALSPDGTMALTGSADKTARIWSVDYHDALCGLCAQLSRDFTTEEREQYGIDDSQPTCPAP